MSEEEWCPIYKWGQRGGTVYVTIFVPCLNEEAVKLNISPLEVDFSAARVATFAGGKTAERKYRLKLNLREEVDESRCAYYLRHDHVRLELAKRKAAPWRSLQAAHVPKNPNERPDFDHMGDDDDDDDDAPAQAMKTYAQRGGATQRQQRSSFFSDFGLDGLLRAIPTVEAWEMLPVAVCMLFLCLCPFNKVEESFNLQATHDLLYHGRDLASYDHHDFPGVVPRTFLGAIALAVTSAPLALFFQLFGAPKMATLLVVRATLGFATCAALLSVHRAARRQFGAKAARAYLLLTSSQFHYLFYASRTLPNTFGGVLCTLAMARWIDGQHVSSVRLLTAAAVAFRSELVLLLAPLCLLMLVRRHIGIVALVGNGLATGALTFIATVLVDSIFWRRLLWPEGMVLYANTVQNMSADYGASPFHWYFTSALPRALLLALPLSLLSIYLVPRARQLVVVPLAFVAIYSLLPHKELRFVLYAVPPLNVAAAAALAHIYTMLPSSKRAKTGSAKSVALLGRLAMVLGLAASVGVSACFLLAARLNYPGAHALLALHRLEATFPKPRVHIGVDAAVSGVSRFLEQPAPWRYSKQEGLSAADYKRFTHLLVSSRDEIPGFVDLHEEHGFAGMKSSPPFFGTESKIKVLKRQRERFTADASSDGKQDFNF